MSEFGKGLTYCLGLFLCHSERDYLITTKDIEKGIINKPYMWFYGAADHMFELEIPTDLPKKLQLKLKKFKGKVMGWRLTLAKEDHATKGDKKWAIQEAKDLLRAIDNFHGIKTSKGDWE